MHHQYISTNAQKKICTYLVNAKECQYIYLTLTVLVTTIDALGHFETG